MDIQSHDEKTLGGASNLFVTFLYAAAVHIVISHPGESGTISDETALIILLFVLFLFSDWLSRVLLPLQLPEKVPALYQLGKTALEVIGLVFLVLMWLASLHGHRIGSLLTHAPAPALGATLDANVAFSAFLVATFFWNLLMLRLMRDLHWMDLGRAGFSGTALDLARLKKYAKRLVAYQERLKQRVAEKLKGKSSTDSTFSNFYIAGGVLVKEGCFRAAAQIVANHLVWSSLIAAAIILASDSIFQGVSLGIAIWREMSLGSLILCFLAIFSLACLVLCVVERRKFWRQATRAFVFSISVLLATILSFFVGDFLAPKWALAVILAAVILAPTFLLFVASGFGKNGKTRKHLLQLGGWVGSVLMLILYLTITPRMLIVVIAVEQVTVSVFLQYAASEPPLDETPA